MRLLIVPAEVDRDLLPTISRLALAAVEGCRQFLICTPFSRNLHFEFEKN